MAMAIIRNYETFDLYEYEMLFFLDRNIPLVKYQLWA